MGAETKEGGESTTLRESISQVVDVFGLIMIVRFLEAMKRKNLGTGDKGMCVDLEGNLIQELPEGSKGRFDRGRKGKGPKEKGRDVIDYTNVGKKR